MFIKLTKLDNSPVWLNASFIVTVEPRKGGGSIVVPIGDGLDYDVRERCEDVLAMVEGAPIPKVVPIPVSDCLTKTPVDVSPEPEPRREDNRAERMEKAVSAEEKNVVALQVSEAPKPAAPDKPAENEAEPEVKKTARKTRAKAKTAKEPKPATARKTRTTRAKKPTLDLSEDEVVRLRKMAPGSVNKLKNTLYTQFHVEDPSRTMLALEAHGILSLDRDHIVWVGTTRQNENSAADATSSSF